MIGKKLEENDLIHNNLRPSTFIIFQNKNIKITDFGLAQKPNLSLEKYLNLFIKLTKNHNNKDYNYKILYLSPELKDIIYNPKNLNNIINNNQ